MQAMLIDAYAGVEFDEDMREQGFDFPAIVPIDHLRPLRRDGRSSVTLTADVRDWIEENCAGQSILAIERDDFLIVFNDPTDAMLFKIRFPEN